MSPDSMPKQDGSEVVDITIFELEFEDAAGPNPRIWQADLNKGMGRFEIVKHYPNKPYFAAYYRNDKWFKGEEPDWCCVSHNILDAAIKCQKKYDGILKDDQ